MGTNVGLMSKLTAIFLSGFVLWIASIGQASATGVGSVECGSLANAYGPFDYRTASQDKKNLVERPHFIDQNIAIMRGQTRARQNHVMGDLDYTLRAFPNHHGALMAIDRLGRLMKTERPLLQHYKLECYYIRGLRMADDDPMLYYLYGMYLQHRGRKIEAREKIERAVEIFEAKDGQMTPNILYNLGLAYFEFGAYDEAAAYARRAADGGYTLPGLKNKLKRVGRW